MLAFFFFQVVGIVGTVLNPKSVENNEVTQSLYFICSVVRGQKQTKYLLWVEDPFHVVKPPGRTLFRFTL